MHETTFQMWRVRVYGEGNRVTHSFRVAADTKEQAERKVCNYTRELMTNVVARPAGKVTFWL